MTHHEPNTIRATLAALAADLDEAAEELQAAITQFNQSFSDYADRVYENGESAAAARAHLLTLRTNINAARITFDRLCAATNDGAMPLDEPAPED